MIEGGKSVSTPKSVAGKLGPVAFAVAPVLDNKMLETAASDLWDHADTVYKSAEEKLAQWDRCLKMSPIDRSVAESLWSEYHQLLCEYKVLLGWHYVTQAAYFFAVNGCGSQYLDDVFEIELVELPDLNVG
jgi:hypothetical protein